MGADWVSIAGWWNERMRGGISFVASGSGTNGGQTSTRRFSYSDALSYAAEPYKVRFVRGSKNLIWLGDKIGTRLQTHLGRPSVGRNED